MLTLDWDGKDEAKKKSSEIPLRLLDFDSSLSCGDRDSANIIVQGDNLDALKSLLPFYRGQVKCIYIDPPYNTGSAFEHYNDNYPHSDWLSMMYPRLELLREFLSADGSIWISIDDDEAHYLKVVCDEIFDRKNFVADVIWEKKYSPQNDAKWLSDSHDFILVYAKNKETWRPNLLPRTDEMNARYRNPDNDPRGLWKPDNALRKDIQPSGLFTIQTPSGRLCNPAAGASWRFSQQKFKEMVEDNRIWFGKNGNNIPAIKRFLSEVQQGTVSKTIWKREEVGDNQDAKKEVKEFNSEDVFTTPKPERLIQRILTLATNEGDLVLDSFLGSGTTAAVAHKMNRHYIGIEMGEQAITHVVPRLQKVIEGEQGGISKSVNWQGGGSFNFYKLGETLCDEFGIINTKVTFHHLAAFIWFSATKMPYLEQKNSPLIGVYDGIAYYLLYNGILGDKRPNGGNVLTKKVLSILPLHYGKKIIYGEACRIGDNFLQENDIIFRQIPKEIDFR